MYHSLFTLVYSGYEHYLTNKIQTTSVLVKEKVWELLGVVNIINKTFMPNTKPKTKDKAFLNRIKDSDLDYEKQIDLVISLRALEQSEDKINTILVNLSESLFKDELNEQTVKDFSDLVSIIESERINYWKLAYMSKKSYLKLLGIEVDIEMKESKLDELYKEFQENK